MNKNKVFIFFFSMLVFTISKSMIDNSMQYTHYLQNVSDITSSVPNEIIDKIFQYCDIKTVSTLKFISQDFFQLSKKYSLPYWKRKNSILLKENSYPIEVKKTFSTEFQIKYFLMDYYNSMAKKDFGKRDLAFSDFLKDEIFSKKNVQIDIKDPGVIFCSNENCSALFIMTGDLIEIGIKRPTINNTIENLYLVAFQSSINHFLKNFKYAENVKILHVIYKSSDYNSIDIELSEDIIRFKNLQELYLEKMNDLKKKFNCYLPPILINVLNIALLSELKILSAPQGILKSGSELLKVPTTIEQLWLGDISYCDLSNFPDLETFIFSFNTLKRGHRLANNFDFLNMPPRLKFIRSFFGFVNESTNASCPLLPVKHRDKDIKGFLIENIKKENIVVEIFPTYYRGSDGSILNYMRKFKVICNDLDISSQDINSRNEFYLSDVTIRCSPMKDMMSNLKIFDQGKMKKLTILFDDKNSMSAAMTAQVITEVFYYFLKLEQILFECELESKIYTIDKNYDINKQLEAIKNDKQLEAIKNDPKKIEHRFCYIHAATLGIFGFLLFMPFFAAIKQKLKL